MFCITFPVLCDTVVSSAEGSLTTDGVDMATNRNYQEAGSSKVENPPYLKHFSLNFVGSRDARGLRSRFKTYKSITQSIARLCPMLNLTKV